jgi:DNA-directed RNA polymerase subunit M/transcription elongation factor TFIIS
MIFNYTKKTKIKKDKNVFLLIPQYCHECKIGVWLRWVKRDSDMTISCKCPECGNTMSIYREEN